MTLISKNKFTAERLITAPRRGPASPNAGGSHLLFTVSTYDLDAHKEVKEIKLMTIKDGSTVLFSSDAADKDPQWLGDQDEVIYLRSTEEGETELWIGSAVGEKGAYFAGKIPTEIDQVKTASLKNGNIAITFSAPTSSNGELVNPKSQPKPKHTAREYSSHPVRSWDSWLSTYRSCLYYTVLVKNGPKFKLSDTIVNALKGTNLMYPNLPGGWLSDSASYDLSSKGILLTTLIPGQNLAHRMLYGLWYIHLTTFQESDPYQTRIQAPEYPGSITAPAFAQTGELAACVVQKSANNIFSERGIAIIHLTRTVQTATILYKFENESGKTWDRLPDSLIWSNDSQTLYIQAEDAGTVRLFKFDIDLSAPTTSMIPMPKRLTDHLSVASVELLSTKDLTEPRLLVSMTGILESSLYNLVDPTGSVKPLSSATNFGADFGLNKHQLTSFVCKGSKNHDIQAWVVRPSSFDPKKKYPLALIIHGGPQSAWNNAWSTRWNPAVYAEQGYVVLLPNPAGSTGFGLDFINAVNGNWGGRPYEDIVACFDYMTKLDYIDTKNVVALGASYGGYMANWIAGQPLAKKLKAIVSHDGIFSNVSMLASDLVAYLDQEVGSVLWEDQQLWQKWSPHYYTHNWETPMLIIHSDNDFRCPINEGLAAYNVCRVKGIESRFLNFPDENHFVLARENSLKWHRVVLGWINKFSGVKGVTLEPACSDIVFEDEPEQ